METAPDVVTIGHAIVDVLSPSDDSLVEQFGLEKGTMTLVDDSQAEKIYAALGPAVEASGGSAANTAACLASFGGSVEFIGRVRDDDLGRVFTHDIRAAGVGFNVAPATAGPPTGRCLIMVTPDAEKTMCTSLGAGAFLRPDDVDTATVAAAKVLYIEGYLCGKPETDPSVEKAITAAVGGGTLVALSASDPFWVQLHRDDLDALLDRVDILFANELEARGLAGADDVVDAIKILSERCSTVAVTLGAEGSTVSSDGSIVSVRAAPVTHLVDTTGAGDSFAAGFLYGVVGGLGAQRSARLGSVAASEIVSHLGARPLERLADLARAENLIA
jgi:sugar/nucleoside kinase (ribokinase family)